MTCETCLDKPTNRWKIKLLDPRCSSQLCLPIQQPSPIDEDPSWSRPCNHTSWIIWFIGKARNYWFFSARVKIQVHIIIFTSKSNKQSIQRVALKQSGNLLCTVFKVQWSLFFDALSPLLVELHQPWPQCRFEFLWAPHPMIQAEASKLPDSTSRQFQAIRCPCYCFHTSTTLNFQLGHFHRFPWHTMPDPYRGIRTLEATAVWLRSSGPMRSNDSALHCHWPIRCHPMTNPKTWKHWWKGEISAVFRTENKNHHRDWVH